MTGSLLSFVLGLTFVASTILCGWVGGRTARGILNGGRSGLSKVLLIVSGVLWSAALGILSVNLIVSEFYHPTLGGFDWFFTALLFWNLAFGVSFLGMALLTAALPRSLRGPQPE